jgi:uncharacterized protein (TIGR00369 family)
VEPKNPAYREKVRAIVDAAPFVADVGIVFTAMGPGWCESVVEVKPKHAQQNGYVHAGVVATMGDHTAGAAAGTLIAADEMVLTTSFQIHLLRPVVGAKVRCRSQVLRHGRTLSVVESEMFAGDSNEEKLVAKATVSLAIVAQR